METKMESSELQQLVPSDGEGEVETEDGISHEDTLNEVKVTSPNKSMQVSSANTSHSSVNRLLGKGHVVGPIAGGVSKISFVNEKRPGRDVHNKTTTASTLRPRNAHKDTTVKHHCFLSEVPDVRHMERALLGLLADFHSGKLRAFGSGCTMDQMTDIREQQERLAKLHFDLGAATDASLSDESLRRSRNTMSQLIQRLEQLSVSIEGLHSNTSD